MRYPKFEQKVQQVAANTTAQTAQSGYGIVIDFDKTNNTADVVMAVPGSGLAGQAYYNVPCPTTIGVQGVTPFPGRAAWVNFKDGNSSFPVITHFFNTGFDTIDYRSQYSAGNGLPKYLQHM